MKHFEPSVLCSSISSYSMPRFWIEFLNKFSGALHAEEDVKEATLPPDEQGVESQDNPESSCSQQSIG